MEQWTLGERVRPSTIHQVQTARAWDQKGSIFFSFLNRVLDDDDGVHHPSGALPSATALFLFLPRWPGWT